MTKDEMADLLRRRHRLTGHNFNAEVLDTWAEMGATVDYGTGLVAMQRAAKKNRNVNWFEFQEALDDHAAGLKNRRDHTIEVIECAQCDGTGWKQAPDIQRYGHTYTQVEPCDHAYSRRPDMAPHWQDRDTA